MFPFLSISLPDVAGIPGVIAWPAILIIAICMLLLAAASRHRADPLNLAGSRPGMSNGQVILVILFVFGLAILGAVIK